MLLQLDVLAAVAAVGSGVLEMVIAVDLDNEIQRIGGEVDLDRPARPKRNPSEVFSRNRPAVSGNDASRSNRKRSAALRARSACEGSGGVAPRSFKA